MAGLPRDPPPRHPPRAPLPCRPSVAGAPAIPALPRPPQPSTGPRVSPLRHVPPRSPGRRAARCTRRPGVTVRFGGVEAVRDVSLRLSAGEIVGLIGPNGAGKSSLLGALGGQLATASGRVMLAGHDVTSLSPHRRARLGLFRTFQHTSTFDGMTVFENLLVAAMSARGSRLRGALAEGKTRRRPRRPRPSGRGCASSTCRRRRTPTVRS